MINIDEILLEKLNEQQFRIINAHENRIVVHAGPGSGKTYTLVRMIEKKLGSIPDYKGVIACSFTKEASNQLKEKTESLCDIRHSFIGTIDAFVLTEIISPFKNRFLNSLGLKPLESEFRFEFPTQQSSAIFLTRQGITSTNRGEINQYCKQWLNKLSKGVYEISFPSYLYAAKMIKDLDIISSYIDGRYDAIYIDEAQDMNEFQHKFLEVIAGYCKLDIVLIGDRNQSIYQFRGARPELFFDLRSKGFTEYEITYSVRCHKSILDYSNMLLIENYDFDLTGDVRIKLNHPPSVENILNISGNFLIVCETRSVIDNVYRYLMENNIDVVLSRRLEIADKVFSDNYLELVEETVRFYLNVLNDNPKLIYSIESYKNFVSNFVTIDLIKDKDIVPDKEELLHYLLRIFGVYNIDVPNEIIKYLESNIGDRLVLNQYTNYDSNINRIMTIHASKGLESDNVFVILDRPFTYDSEYKRKMFVAFSRAKHFLYISKSKDARTSNQPYDHLLVKNLELITNMYK